MARTSASIGTITILVTFGSLNALASTVAIYSLSANSMVQVERPDPPPAPVLSADVECRARLLVSNQEKLIDADMCPSEARDWVVGALSEWTVIPLSTESSGAADLQLELPVNVSLGKNGKVRNLWVFAPDQSGVWDVPFTSLKMLSSPQPVYPKKHRKHGLAVSCTLRFTVDTAGNSAQHEVSGCPEAFAAETLRAGKELRFQPYVVDGVAQTARSLLIVKYNVK